MQCWRREGDAPNKEILTMVRRVWLASGPICPSDSLPSDLPLQPSYAGEPEHIPLREFNGWTRFKVKLSQPLVRPEGSEFALASQPPTASMTRVAFQHFLTRSERRSFNTCLVLFEFIEFLTFDFHIAHIVIAGCVVSRSVCCGRFRRHLRPVPRCCFAPYIIFLAVSHASA